MLFYPGGIHAINSIERSSVSYSASHAELASVRLAFGLSDDSVDEFSFRKVVAERHVGTAAEKHQSYERDFIHVILTSSLNRWPPVFLSVRTWTR